MVRLTQAQAIEAQNEEQALVFFKKTLSEITRPTSAFRKRYSFEAVIVIALMASMDQP